MKKTILLIFGCLIIFSVTVLAQVPREKTLTEIENEKARRAEDALKSTSELSVASRILHARLSEPVSSEDRIKLLQDAVLVGDRSIIPYLKARLEGGYGPVHHLDLALVALGETQYVEKAIEELKSEKYFVQVYAIWKLARFKTKESYRKLYELLDDDAPRGDSKAEDAVALPLSAVVKDQLYYTVENKPSSQFSTRVWKEWFIANNLID